MRKQVDLSQIKSIPGFPNFYDFHCEEISLPPYGSDELKAIEESESLKHSERRKRIGEIQSSFRSSSYDLRCGACGDCKSLGKEKGKMMMDAVARDVQHLVNESKITPENAFRQAFNNMLEGFCKKLKKGYPNYLQTLDQMAWAVEDLEGISGACLQRILEYKKDIESGLKDCDNKRSPNYRMISKKIQNFMSELSSAKEYVDEMKRNFYDLHGSENTFELSSYLKSTFRKESDEFRSLRNELLHKGPKFGLHTEYSGGCATVFFDFVDGYDWRQVELFEHLLGFYKYVSDSTIKAIEYIVKPK